jgi:membrane protein required for colicin V production
MGLSLMLSVTHFSLLDFLIIIIMVWCIVSSAMKGFVREVFGLATLLAAILLAAWLYHRTAPLFKDVVKTENLALFFAFCVIFFGTLVVGFVVIWLVTRFMKFAKLQWFDRVLGAAFGFIRGWAFGAVLLLGLTAFNVQTERVRSSDLAPYFLPGARVIATVTPYDLKARFLVEYRAIEKWWREQK